MSISKGYIATSTGQVHYRTTRMQAELPIVLLHQTASSSMMFTALMGELGSDYWLIAPDTPGFGQSFTPQKQQATITFYAQSIYEFLQGLFIKECYLFGHHTGAAIALQLATDQPGLVRKLALSGIPLLTAGQITELEKGLQPMEILANGRHLQQLWQHIQKKAPTASVELIQRETLLTLQAGKSYHEAYHAVFAQAVAEQLAALQCPTMVMAGEYDSLRASLEPAYDLLKQGSMQIIPRAGSFICDQQPQVIAEILSTFFSKHNQEIVYSE